MKNNYEFERLPINEALDRASSRPPEPYQPSRPVKGGNGVLNFYQQQSRARKEERLNWKQWLMIIVVSLLIGWGVQALGCEILESFADGSGWIQSNDDAWLWSLGLGFIAIIVTALLTGLGMVVAEANNVRDSHLRIRPCRKKR